MLYPRELHTSVSHEDMEIGTYPGFKLLEDQQTTRPYPPPQGVRDLGAALHSRQQEGGRRKGMLPPPLRKDSQKQRSTLPLTCPSAAWPCPAGGEAGGSFTKEEGAREQEQGSDLPHKRR